MIIDHAQRIDRLQRVLAEAWLERPSLLNVPGASLACKLDPYYYLGLYPGVVDFFAIRCGMFHANVLQHLVRTGNLLVHPQGGTPRITLRVVWKEGQRRARLDGCFLHSDFIDRALMLYAGEPHEQPVSSLSIDAREKQRIALLLQGKTPLQKMAFRGSAG